ncbi:hypothetical protein E8E11_007170 [Didymella keratinophila]|nr:hypothetical protein E8E11_007170 [Didymella keratinophila]
MAPQPGFFDKHMDTVDTCSICLEPFGPSHPPARLNVDGDPCKHIFGAPCLREWVMADSWNSNRCPVCRTRMFYYSDEDETGDENSDEDGDEEISDAEVSDEEVSDDSSDDGSAVSEVEEMQDAPVTDEPNENVVLFENMSRGTVRCFVLNLYNEVCDVDYAVLGTENDFEDKFMVKCMTRACQEVGLGDDFSIRIVDIPKVRRVVMRMVRRHKGAGLTFEQWHYWTMEMQRAVKWQHGDVAAPEDDARVVYGPLTQAQTIYQQWQARKREEEAAARNREAAAQARLAVWQPGRPF